MESLCHGEADAHEMKLGAQAVVAARAENGSWCVYSDEYSGALQVITDFYLNDELEPLSRNRLNQKNFGQVFVINCVLLYVMTIQLFYSTFVSRLARSHN